MRFLKKNIVYLIILLACFTIGVLPGWKDKIRDYLFPIATVESYVHIPDSDYDLALKGINTPDTNLKNFKGKKTLFLNFWGTWCGPCRKEWPTVQSLYDAKKDKMDFVLIAMQDKEEDVRQFISENHYTAPVYIAMSPIGERILPKAFPTTFLLDKTGRILKKIDFSYNWTSAESLRFIQNISQ